MTYPVQWKPEDIEAVIRMEKENYARAAIARTFNTTIGAVSGLIYRLRAQGVMPAIDRRNGRTERYGVTRKSGGKRKSSLNGRMVGVIEAVRPSSEPELHPMPRRKLLSADPAMLALADMKVEEPEPITIHTLQSHHCKAVMNALYDGLPTYCGNHRIRFLKYGRGGSVECVSPYCAGHHRQYHGAGVASVA